MELIKKMTTEEKAEWFKNNKPEFIKEKEKEDTKIGEVFDVETNKTISAMESNT